MSGTGVLVVEAPGLATSVQDAGRRGHARLGIPPSGALDSEALAVALALAGAPAGAAALECRYLGPVLRAERAPVRVALAGGEAEMAVTRADGAREQAGGWRSVTLAPGDRLRVGALRGSATACLALCGGIDVAPVMGSRSTLTRARLGGIGGRLLAEGDRIAAAALPEGPERAVAAPEAWVDDAPVAVVPGPQADHFTGAAHALLTATAWRISDRADRMGLRLDGPHLEHASAPGRGADIVSDAIVTGAIQVPASGQPILLLADRQTSGGYAKIATVITADLPRLARLGPGAMLRFEAVDAVEGARRSRAARAALDRLIAAIAPLAEGPDLTALYRENLITARIDEET
ncbi:MAG: biotin-dependent carboxyltransferase family protein [Pseudomonadota bacterium]